MDTTSESVERLLSDHGRKELNNGPSSIAVQEEMSETPEESALMQAGTETTEQPLGGTATMA
jgi:hypothetical protein